MIQRLSRILTVAAATLAAGAPCAGAADYRPDEVVVRFAPGADRAAIARATGTAVTGAFAPRARVLRIRDGASVAQAVAALRRAPGVVSANPNFVARASGFVPNDPGRDPTPGGWQSLQWNFVGEFGVNVAPAWDALIAQSRPGAAGVTVAVLDTGVAYADRGRFRRSPDLAKRTFVRGYDFVDDDPWPNDENGHGTHVASTIAEHTGNGYGAAGIAYGARIMPVRVLDQRGEGDASVIAAGIRFAARKGVPIINLSFEFSASVTGDQIPDIVDAIRYARNKGAIVVGASGNEARRAVAYPARTSGVLAVGAITEHGCQADYSNDGPELDIVAPGGGADAALPDDPVHCRPLEAPGRDIVQVTFTGSVRKFGLPNGYQGTSMAAPHVSAVAALVLASGVLGPHPSGRALERRLTATARDLGAPGRDVVYGNGLVDAGAAVGATAPARATSSG